eukprot:11482178-Heterocapsa_arctica.AAC.1
MEEQQEDRREEWQTLDRHHFIRSLSGPDPRRPGTSASGPQQHGSSAMSTCGSRSRSETSTRGTRGWPRRSRQ